VVGVVLDSPSMVMNSLETKPSIPFIEILYQPLLSPKTLTT